MLEGTSRYGASIVDALLLGFVFLLSSAHVAQAADSSGISASRILLGQPAVFSGPSAGLGVEIWRGMEAALRKQNSKGGVHNRMLEVQLCDDRYEPGGAAKCARDLIFKHKAFLLVNSVGTPTMVGMVPLLESWKNHHVMLFGNFTGAQVQRSMPFARYVFNVRASYHQETAGHVAGCLDAGLTKIGTYVQHDAYGKDGLEGVRSALKKVGRSITAETLYKRHTKYTDDVSAQVKTLQEAGVNCISTTGSYQGIGALIRTARAQGWNVPIFSVSFTGADQLLQFLKSSGGDATTAVVVSQVVPHYDDTSLPLVREYREVMNEFKVSLPKSPFDGGGYKPAGVYSFGSLEGYLNTRLLVEVLQRAGKDITRQSFRNAAEKIHKLDLGLGKDNLITWGPVTSDATRYNHQALNRVWFTGIKDGEWVSLDTAGALKKNITAPRRGQPQ